MRHFLIAFLVSTVLTFSFYAVAIFLPGLELFCLPIMMILFFIGVIGIVTIPLGIYKIVRQQTANKRLKQLIGVSLGFYVGLLAEKPMTDWDENKRNFSGQILSSEIEKYKDTFGVYPDSIGQLSIASLNERLPSTYKSERFGYYIKDGEYNLYIPIPIFDRWI